MNENVKTIIYVAVAAAFGVAAFATLPRTTEVNSESRVGQPLFPQFDDTSKAASLEITWYDDTLSSVNSFRVAKERGKWVVPSHDNYPADAEQQLQDSAQSLFQLDCLHVASEIATDHELYGVIEPPQDETAASKKEYGKLIVLQNEKSDDLVRILVGKEVEGSPGQRFVRIAESQGNLTDAVYITKIDPTRIPTEFGKWIERDLLQLNPNDVAALTLKDYSIVRQPTQTGVRNVVQPKMDARVSWDNLSGTWNLDSFQIYAGNQAHDAQLGEEEELAKTKLDDLKNALDDLKIESVERKPAGLGAEFALDEKFLANEELMTSLVEHGFFAGGRDKIEIFSRNGEVNVDCADGVRYVLRFGDVAGVQEGAGLEKLNRFLLVSAQLADDMLPKPVLEEMPAGPEASPPAGDPAAEEASGGGCQEEENQAKANEKQPDAGAKGDVKAKSDAKAEPPLDREQLRREAIKRDNERKLREYDEKLKKAQGRVASLNSRFADWYYVISEDTYKKIHLGRNDIIQEGAGAKDTGFGVDAFRKLESDGLKKNAPPMAGSSPGGFPGGGFPGAP
ncbi:MAG TPA: DUF4340 domain-containing protein [Pirellulaceae bacterium]|nr:DUF4340 domain-containing protein [Pirellulaceae bacterium]